MPNKEYTKTIHIEQEGFTEHDIEISLLNPAIPVVKKGNEQKVTCLEKLAGKTTDCRLYLRGYACDDAFPVTEAHFSKGKFLYATGYYTLGPGYNPVDGQFITKLPDFLAFLENYFTAGQHRISRKQFAAFIHESNLPNRFVTAVQDLLSK